jgi:hypothetical protein
MMTLSVSWYSCPIGQSTGKHFWVHIITFAHGGHGKEMPTNAVKTRPQIGGLPLS